MSVLNGTSTDMTDLRDEVEALLDDTGSTSELRAILFDTSVDDGEVAARSLSFALRLREEASAV